MVGSRVGGIRRERVVMDSWGALDIHTYLAILYQFAVGGGTGDEYVCGFGGGWKCPFLDLRAWIYFYCFPA